VPRSLLSATVLLTFATGVVDVSAFLALGHVFASVMTGNLVLLGLAAGTRDTTLARSVGTALLGYAVGVAVSGLLERLASAPRARWVALTGAHLVGLLVWTLLWVGTGGAGEAGQLATLAAAAGTMGVQSTLVRAVGGQGLSTTYLTSTLTRLVWELGHHGSTDWWDPLRCLALVVGAVVGGLLAHHGSPWTPAPALVAVVLATMLWRHAAPAEIAAD
jgi:uncharacterized membrane protein YoaK (UPF0700 family)